MKFSVGRLCVLRSDRDSESARKSDNDCSFHKTELPKLQWVPAIQRRRLSPFMKLSVHAAYEASEGKSLPVVFSTRHGDLHKTSLLLDSIAQNEALSPTAFSFSVHNAAAGLFSILTGNKEAANVVSAGKNTFFMALVDAYSRLVALNLDAILVIHCDMALPTDYSEFQDEKQIDHCLAFVMHKEQEGDLSIEVLTDVGEFQEESESLPLALQFHDLIDGKLGTAHLFVGDNNQWKAVVSS